MPRFPRFVNNSQLTPKAIKQNSQYDINNKKLYKLDRSSYTLCNVIRCTNLVMALCFSILSSLLISSPRSAVMAIVSNLEVCILDHNEDDSCDEKADDDDEADVSGGSEESRAFFFFFFFSSLFLSDFMDADLTINRIRRKGKFSWKFV